MDVDYNKLKVFLAIVRCESLTGAAKELHRTQSAISQTLSALERQLEMKLVTWEGKQLQLTREGKLVYHAAEGRFSAIDEQLEAIKFSGKEVGGCIEIGMLNDASTQMHELIFAKISQFRKMYPSVTFNIHFTTSSRIEQALLNRELDLGFLINFQSQLRFSLLEILTEQHLIVTSPHYLEKIGKVAGVRDVLAHDLIDIDPYFTCFTPWVAHHDSAALALLEKKSPVIMVPDFRLIRKLVLANQGIAVVPKYLIDDDLEQGRIVQLLPEISPLRVWVSCAIERGRQVRPCEELFLKAVQT